MIDKIKLETYISRSDLDKTSKCPFFEKNDMFTLWLSKLSFNYHL